MNCPYCKRSIAGITGMMEAQRFARHLGRCRKNPNNIVITDGRRTVVTPKAPQLLLDAVRIRDESGQ